MTKLKTLQNGENLNTDQALEWLASQGIHTSRSGLEVARRNGRLMWIRAHGRYRILYKCEHLAAAFIEGIQSCPSSSPEETTPATITSAELLPDQIFTKALEQATQKPQKTSASGRKRKSSNVYRLGEKRQ